MCDLRLFGAMELAGTAAADLGPPQRRAVLAVLALNAGTAVSVDGLVERLWTEPPDRARRAVYVHVTRLRQLLGGRIAIVTTAGGYRLELDRDQVDLLRFERLVRVGAARPVDDANRRTWLRDALGLWRGTPLADLSGAWADRIRQRWRRVRADALQYWAEGELAAGQAAAVVRRLRDALAENPAAEPLAALLMRALAATGQAPEAVRIFGTLREHLVEELGVEPGPAVQDVHRMILRRNLATPEPPTPQRQPLAQLPTLVDGFVGRAAELARLSAAVESTIGANAAVPIGVVTGPPGVGKTALAVRWAHEHRDRFPDGQLYADLHGSGPGAPAPPERVITGFVRALGTSEQPLPAHLDELSALLRSRLAGRRLLVVLDNAATAEQVYPLLPGTGSCAVLVTSRDPLAGVVARYGGRRVHLGPLPDDASVALLRALVDRRYRDEEETLRIIAGSCEGLPLALRYAAERGVAAVGTHG
jgi:DNA-binding SARP family transcriptional activator